MIISLEAAFTRIVVSYYLGKKADFLELKLRNWPIYYEYLHFVNSCFADISWFFQVSSGQDL